MEFSFDIPLFITLLGIMMVIIPGLIFYGKSNFLTRRQEGIVQDIKEQHGALLIKAKRYTSGKRVKGLKLKLQRHLEPCLEDYRPPKSVLTISGISVVCWLFCLFLIVSGFIYSGTKSSAALNAILLTSQMVLVAMLILAWFRANNDVVKPHLFLIQSFRWWLIATVVGVGMALTHCFIPVLSQKMTTVIFYLYVCIPLIPAIFAVISTYNLYRNEKKKFADFFMVLEEFEEYELPKGKKQRKKVS